ncbi:Ger(x)C family spore germination protein [Oceanobacillus saliphilus]|uniref:Ger(x)C family spore germination protein n=1 Tax=Oceanobacillus saliphilus TaxID=2925834 RepID=UPI00201E4F1D|nr:Ger(x)C family spore germination protein [Oceanobacillus saliphilus]
MQIRITIIMLTTIILLAACVPARQLEERGVINTRGVDIAEDSSNQIETTIISYQFDAESEEITTTLSGTGHTIKGAREDASTEAGFILSPGQIRLELYGKEAAQKGILPYISSAVRDARVSDTMLLAVTNTSAKEILTEGQGELSLNTGQYLQYLIEKEIEEDSFPSTYLHDFTHIESDVGHDPVMPIIDLVENKPKISGIALFQDDKYVDEISLQEGYLVNLFQNTTTSTPLDISIPIKPFLKYIEKNQDINEDDELHLHVTIERGKSKTKMPNVQDMHFDTTINIDLFLLETSKLMSVDNEHVATLLEKEIEKAFTRQYETLFAKLQKAGTDPFGLGKIYRARQRDSNLTNEEWRKKFPDVTLNVNVNVKLTNYGTIQ